MRSLRDTGITLVIVEQSLSVICERAVFMEKGEIRFQGPATELLERDDLARAVFLGGHGDGARQTGGGGSDVRAQPSTTRAAATTELRWARPAAQPEWRPSTA